MKHTIKSIKIGMQVTDNNNDKFCVTGIEGNRVRVIKDFVATPEDIENWKEFTPGILLTVTESKQLKIA